MYKAVYEVRTNKTPNQENSTTYLEAKFNFGEEIAPKDKELAKEVIGFILKGKHPAYFLPEDGPLENVYGKNIFNNFFRTYNGKMIKIRKYFFSLGFDLTITARGKVPVPLEKMVDLEGLNNLVLQKK